MAAATQANRQIAIGTPLGDDVLLLESFDFTDALGKPFQIDAVVRCEGSSVDPASLIGQNVTIRLDVDPEGNQTRYLNGYVSRFSLSGSAEGGVPSYSMTIVPFLTLLGRAADCRCFQNKSAPDIVQDLAKERGFTDISVSLSETYPQREFCVQYRETVLNFMRRLMEEEGIYVFFKHEDGKHSAVLADNRSAHSSIGPLKYAKHSDDPGSVTIDQWSLQQEARSGGYTLIDYNYLTPRTLLSVTKSDPKGHAQADHELVDYPGGFTQRSDGERIAKTRLEETQARFEVAHGTTNSRQLAAGTIFTLTDHPVDSQNQEWLVTSVSLHAATAGYSGVDSGSEAGETHFTCSFTAIPASTPFRPARVTPEPVIIGPQPAVVVGPKGEEIYTDEYGRVKVAFVWDRYAKADETA
jgi:type VI secretion system secreted protein VgrG